MSEEIPGPANADFESCPLTRQEYISAMVHFYRGELTRANAWRLRLDNTTNWAVLSTMGLLSFAFSLPEHTHASIPIGMMLVFHFLRVEARRYRFFDVWRNRVRMIEENFYGPLLTRDLESPHVRWGQLVANDLLDPRFKITRLQAFKVRFQRNYRMLFFLLLLAWIVKLSMHPQIDPESGFWLERMAVGIVPWYVVLGGVGSLYFFFVLLTFFVPPAPSQEQNYWSERPSFGKVDF